MKDSYNPQLNELLLQVVDNQLRENEPPITKTTLDRLVAAGHTEQQAKEMIAAVVIGSIYDALKDGIPFDEEHYTSELNTLR